MTDLVIALFAAAILLALGTTLWVLACDLSERAARRRCCTGEPSTNWLADRCDECGRRHHTRRAS